MPAIYIGVATLDFLKLLIEKVFILEDRRKHKQFKLRLSQEDINYIKNKSNELDYKTVSAFVIDSAKNHFVVELDMKIYRELAKEINYIGKNINSLIRRINTDGFYSDNDFDFIETNQKKIIELLKKEYIDLLNMRKKYSSSKMSLKDKENLIKALQQNEIQVPKSVVLDEVFERLKADLIYIVQVIEQSPAHDELVSEYVWQYIYGNTFYELDQEQLIQMSDEIFMFVQKIKFKLMNLDNHFNDDDWDEFKDILDDYEVY